MNTKTTPMTAEQVLTKYMKGLETVEVAKGFILSAMQEYANQFKPKEATTDDQVLAVVVTDKEIHAYIKALGILDHSHSADMQMIAEWMRNKLTTIKSSETARQIMEENFKGLASCIKDKDLLYFYKELIVTCIEHGSSGESEAVEFFIWMKSRYYGGNNGYVANGLLPNEIGQSVTELYKEFKSKQ